MPKHPAVLTWATRRPLPFIVAGILLGVTVLLAWVGFAHDRERTDRARDEAAQQAVVAVGSVVDGVEDGVRSLGGLFVAGDGVSQRAFSVYARPLLANHRAAALAWATVVSDDQRRAFEREHGTIRGLRRAALGAADDAPAYTVVTLLESQIGGARGRLVDLRSFPRIDAILRRAAASGRLVASPPLVVPGFLGPSFAMVLPVYRGDGAAARRQRVQGFGVGLFRFADLRDALLRAVPSGTAVEVRLEGEAVATIGDPGSDAEQRTASFVDRDWTVRVQPVAGGGVGLGWTALIVGLLLTVLLTLFTRQAVRAEAAARELAALRQRERDSLAVASKTLLDHLDELFVIQYDRDLRIVRAAGALLKRQGVDAADLEGRLRTELAEPDRYPQISEALRQGLEGRHVSFDLEETAEGMLLWMQAIPLDGNSDVLLVGMDVTARRAAELRFRRSFEDAPVGMALLDADGRYAEVNQALCEILGRDAAQLAGASFAAATHSDDAAAERDRLGTLLAGRAPRVSFEKRTLRPDGQAVWVAVHATALGPFDGSAPLYLVQILDVSDQRRVEGQLRHLADHDPLTGLENRRAFERAIADHLASVRRYGATGALLILDLDHFKAVNDTLGHHAGDELIVAVAALLRGAVRESDRVARLGGDEFAVLLPRADERQAAAVAAKLVAAIREDRRVLGGRSLATTVSVGVAPFHSGDRTAEQMLVDADLAMYDAKEAGRDGYAVFRRDGVSGSRTQTHLAWLDRIRGALDEERFTFLAQPILDLATDRVVHHELLLRMVGADGDLVPPSDFLEIAERFGLVADIDTWAVRRAIRTLAEHADAGLTLEVNLSGSSIGSSELLATIESELAATGVDPRALIFEITETAAVSNIPRARAFADRLAALGCRFALDDFGAGFGSFYYLKHLPFDFLKIDGEFVRQCASSPIDRVIVSSLVRVASGLGKRTIAEYVDDVSTLAALRELGVDMAQGYAVGRPAPLERWLCAGAT